MKGKLIKLPRIRKKNQEFRLTKMLEKLKLRLIISKDSKIKCKTIYSMTNIETDLIGFPVKIKCN